MKRVNDLYKYICDEDNIRLAHKNARKGKLHYKEVIKVDANEDYYISLIKNMLEEKTFVCGTYKSFIKSDSGKERVIHKLPYFPDRIIQHAILQVLEPIWKKSLIEDTYQAIRGRGVHACLKKVKHVVQSEDYKDVSLYCLQMDVKKFYPSIDNEILKVVIRKKIKCKDTLSLLDKIIDGSCGVPIGNYISQYFGNLYLNELDHYIKEVLRAKNYYRYCDDLIVLSEDKEFLKEVLEYTKQYLTSIKLEIKEDFQIYKITNKRGVGCLGYIVYKDRVKLRRNIAVGFEDSINSMLKSGKVNLKSLGSYYGWIKHTKSIGLWVKNINKLLPTATGADKRRIFSLTTKLKNQ